MRQLKTLYTSFDQHIAGYTRDLLGVKKSLYREEKGVDVLMTNLTSFFSEEKYTSTLFKRYEKLFKEDYVYLVELFPEKGYTPFPLSFPQYQQLSSLEYYRAFLQKFLDILTLSLWRVLVK